jgi:hypothetical protein
MAEEATKPSRPKVDFRERKDFDFQDADFGESINKDIEEWLNESIRVELEAHDTLFKQKVPEWRRICDGQPREKNKSFPWPNAANYVVQVAGQACDDIAARVIGLIWNIAPVAMFRYFQKTDDLKRQSNKKKILEQFIDAVAFDPRELDLYRKENIWFAESAKLGTSFLAVRPEKCVEVERVGYSDKRKVVQLDTTELYSGPAIDNVEYENVLCNSSAPTWKDSRLKVQIIPTAKHELQERAFTGYYNQDAVDRILEKPDRHGPSINKQREQSKKGINQGQASALAEWDIYACWFWWYVTMRSKEGKPAKVKVQLLTSYHYSSRTILRQVFNFCPKNAVPIIPTKLSISDKGVRGRGYAELLWNAQEEISTAHNQRTDARTMAITGIFRTSNSALDKDISVYPFCMIPAQKDELELLKNQTDIGDGGLEDEIHTLQLASDRAGISPAMSGLGTGVLNKKGQYGSMGTLAILSLSDSRTSHRVSDFRHSHISIIDLCTAMYGKFGTGQRGSLFGLDDAILREALADYTDGKIRIPVRAATASVNQEADKQNLLLLKKTLQEHTEEKIKMMQALQMNTNMDPLAKKTLMDAIQSQDEMMRRLLREFSLTDTPEEFVPEVETQNAPQGQARAVATGPDPRVIGMARALPQSGPSVPSSGVGGMEASVPGLGGTNTGSL